MKTRIVTFAIALATFSVAGVQPSFRGEAFADETSLADILAALRSQDSKTRAAAADHLGRKAATDTKVLEALLRALNDSDDDVRQSAAASLQRLGSPSVSYLRKALDSKSARVRALAALSLGHIRPVPREAVPDLMRLAQDDDSDVRYEALHALAQIRDPKAIATLIGVAKADSDRRVRISAIDLLSNFGPDAREAIPFLMDLMRTELLALQEEPPEFSLAASETLASIGVPAVEPVAKVLSNKASSSVLRQTAAQILSRIATRLGPDAIKSSLPALIDASMDTDQEVRLQGALTIRHLGQHAKVALGILKDRLKNSSGRERIIMAGTILRIEPSNSEVIDMLVNELRAREVGTRYLAGLELSEVPSLGETAVDPLIAAVGDPNKDVRLVAIRALRQVSPRTPKIVAALKKVCSD